VSLGAAPPKLGLNSFGTGANALLLSLLIPHQPTIVVNNVLLFAAGEDFNLYYVEGIGTTWQWHNAGNPSTSENPVVVVSYLGAASSDNVPSGQMIVCVSTDDGIYRYQNNGSGWNWVSADGPPM
jgi:hypothetical protein